mgnify:FL=1
MAKPPHIADTAHDDGAHAVGDKIPHGVFVLGRASLSLAIEKPIAGELPHFPKNADREKRDDSCTPNK